MHGEQHLQQGDDYQRGNDTRLAEEIVDGNAGYQRANNVHHRDFRQRSQPAGSFQNGHFTARYGHQANDRREKDVMKGMISPGESPFIEQGTQQSTHQHTQ